MKISKLLAYGIVALFSLSLFAQDADFGDEPPSTTPSTDVSAPPSTDGDYNKDLTDAVGNEEPKVPQPESNTAKPAVTKPPSDSVKKDSTATKPKKKEKKEKKEKKAKKDKKNKKEKKAGKKEKAGKKGKKSDKKTEKKGKKKPTHADAN